MKNYYEILEVKPTATLEEIRAQHKFLLHAWHPDKFPNTDQKKKAEDKLRDINEAYSILSNTERRENFDKILNPYAPPTNRETKSQSYQATPSSNQPRSQSSSQPTSRSGHYCEGCGQEAEIKNVTFYENVGMIFARRYRSAQGKFCKNCIDYFFWNFTGKTMLLGWWGTISLIVTPFVLLINLINFVSSISLEPPPLQKTPKPATGWVLSTVGGFFLIGYVLISVFFSQPTYQTNIPIAAIQPTQTSKSTAFVIVKTPTHQNCLKASSITSAMEGKVSCVYGVITRTESSEGGFNVGVQTRIRFGDQSTFFIVTDFNNPYSKGDCVTTKGKILLSSEKIPYIKVDNKINKCESWMK